MAGIDSNLVGHVAAGSNHDQIFVSPISGTDKDARLKTTATELNSAELGVDWLEIVQNTASSIAPILKGEVVPGDDEYNTALIKGAQVIVDILNVSVLEAGKDGTVSMSSDEVGDRGEKFRQDLGRLLSQTKNKEKPTE